MSKQYDIFISPPLEDREWTGALVRALKNQGLSVWYADIDIKPGDLLVDRIHEGLKESQSVVFVLGAKVSQPNWLAAMLGAALGLSKRIIPIVPEGIQPGELPGPIRVRHYLTKQDPGKAAEEIARAIKTEAEGVEA